MKRISITVSDELKARIDKYKKELNISDIARKAIDKEIREKELWGEESIKELGETIKRLRKEKQKLDSAWQKIGLKKGQEWVNQATLGELRAYERDLPTLNRVNELWPNDDTLSTYADEFQDHEDWTDSAAQEFWKGFAQGFMILWNKLKKEI